MDYAYEIAVSAVHESGHAVAAHLLGVRVTSIEVWNIGGGLVRHDSVGDGDIRNAPVAVRRARFRRRAIISVAGPLAELAGC